MSVKLFALTSLLALSVASPMAIWAADQGGTGNSSGAKGELADPPKAGPQSQTPSPSDSLLGDDLGMSPVPLAGAPMTSPSVFPQPPRSPAAPVQIGPPPVPPETAEIAKSPFFQHARARISRLYAVSPELVRGGQPDSGGLYYLKKAGIKTVINLRDLGNKFDSEEKEAKSMGLNYVNIPMSHTAPVPNQVIRRFLSIVKNPQMQPVYVHCKQGADRTGAMVGIYRIERHGWTPTQAYREMLSFNFHPILRPLVNSLYEFGAKKGKYEPLPPFQDGIQDVMRRAQWFLDNI